MKHIYIFFAAALFLSSCKVSQPVLKPLDDLPATFTGTSAGASEAIGNLSVSEFFNNPVMLNLIDSALARNTDLQIAIKNIDAAQLILSSAKLSNLPQVNLQVTAGINRPSDNSLNGLSTSQFLQTTHIEDFNTNVAISWEADIWGKIKNQKLAAYNAFLQSGEVKKAVQTRLVSNVANTFYQLLMLDAQLKVANSNVELANNTVKMIKLQFNAGQVTALAIQQAEAQQLMATQLLPQIKREIAIQENALNALTGRFPGVMERSSDLNDLAIPQQFAAGIPADMLKIRPDVKAVELELNIANARVGIANAKLYPSLVISASGGLNSFKASNWFNIPASLFGVVGGGITQPIFQHKQLKTQFELAKIDREKSVLQFRQTVIAAVAEVSNEQAKLEHLSTEYAIAQKKVSTLQTAVKNSDMLFKSGMANYLEVITAQVNLLRGELELTTLKTAQLSTGVNLYRALGGGWR